MMPAPAPFQMQPLQFLQPKDNSGQIKQLVSNVGAAAKAMQPGPATAVDPGSAVPGAQGPTSVGGPAGPVPLVQPGTVAPNPAAPGVAPGVGQAGNIAAGPVAPPQPQPQQPLQQPPNMIQNIIRNLAPPQLLALLQQSSRTGTPIANMLPGSAATNNAGMLPATMNNPSQWGG